MFNGVMKLVWNMTILSIRLCKKCRKRLEKNPHILGDYDEEGTLLSFCPMCGEGFPLLNSGVLITISHRKLKIISTRIANTYELSPKEIDKLTTPLNGASIYRAIKKLRNEINKKYQIDLSPDIFSGI